MIVFTTDNGGPAAGFDLNSACNFPLRGVKATLWEGKALYEIMILFIRKRVVLGCSRFYLVLSLFKGSANCQCHHRRHKLTS